MIRSLIGKQIARMWVAIFMWSGNRVFPIHVVWQESDEHEFSVAHFAWTERDLNCACRDYVEGLDKQYEVQT